MGEGTEGKKLVMAVDSPWGVFESSENDPIVLIGIKVGAKQLQHYIDWNMHPDLEHTKNDLEGYKQILETGSEDVARSFMKRKHEALSNNTPYKNNLTVIEAMKENDEWVKKN